MKKEDNGCSLLVGAAIIFPVCFVFFYAVLCVISYFITIITHFVVVWYIPVLLAFIISCVWSGDGLIKITNKE